MMGRNGMANKVNGNIDTIKARISVYFVYSIPYINTIYRSKESIVNNMPNATLLKIYSVSDRF